MSRSAREFLHTPGPTHVPDRVLNAMHRQPLDLADPRLLDLAASCFRDLKPIFKTSGEVFLYAANGHGGWEAALSNLFEPGDRVLVPEIGHFSAGWARHAAALGLKVELIEGDWRRAVDPQLVEDALRQDRDKRIKGLLVVQTDTATGITADIASMRRAIDAADHPALLVVDAVASLAASELDMDAWGVNAAIGASQKALMGPPGLAFVAADARAIEVAAGKSTHRCYWDWTRRSKPEVYMRFGGTAPEHALFGLREALDIIAEEGLAQMINRHARLAAAVRTAVECWAEAGVLSFNALVPAQRSNSVTAIRVTEELNAGTIRDYLRENLGVALGGGLGGLDGKVFRIGHLGSLNEPMVLGCLAAVETGLLKLGIPHGRGGLRMAVEGLARDFSDGSDKAVSPA